MTKIVFALHDGERRHIDARDGDSVMETALAHDIPGIVAECGGSMTCGTCHVVVDPAWAERVGAAAGDELDLVEVAPERQASSRLSCQLKVSPELAGLVVLVPSRQR